jgi:hypothetical protein
MKSQQHNKNISLTYHNINRLPCKSCFKKEVFGGANIALQKWHYRMALRRALQKWHYSNGITEMALQKKSCRTNCNSS